MENTTHLPSGFRHSNLKKSFKRGILSLLTACSKEEFNKAFSTFNSAEQEGLHRLFIQKKSSCDSDQSTCWQKNGLSNIFTMKVITSLHDNIEEEFDSICLETQVGNTLDTVEQLVEEQSLDILSADKVNLGDLKEEVTRAKKNEIHQLTSMLEKAVEQNNLVRARVESLKDGQDLSVTSDAVEKLRGWNLNYAQIS